MAGSLLRESWAGRKKQRVLYTAEAERPVECIVTKRVEESHDVFVGVVGSEA